jgi:tetratricopeptide (TPR) repeat protein
MARVPLDGGIVDLEGHQVLGRRGAVGLTATEAAPLRFLLEHPRRTFTQQELLVRVWGYHPDAESRTVYTTVTRLRAKIEADPGQPRHLIAVRGQGYRFEPPTCPRRPGLPRLPDPLLGRDDALARLDAWLGVEDLVVLHGPVGAGTSTLAAAAAAAAWDRFAGAVHWIDAGADRAARLGGSMACAEEALLARLADRPPFLVVLDGHPGPFDDVEAWARASSPGSSWVVATTAAPDLGRRLAVGGLARGDAAALLRAVSGLDDLDPDALDTIVDRTDGLPLALRIAAGLLEGMTPAQLARQLTLAGHGFLEGLPDGLVRLWEGLPEADRQELARVSVFRGPFTAEEADEVAGVEPVTLARWVRASLVRRTQAGFRPYAGVRALARQILSPDDPVHARHAAAMVAWAEALVAPPVPIDAGHRVDARRDDVAGAYQWALGEVPALACRLALAWDRGLSLRMVQGAREPLLTSVLDLTDSAATRCEALLRRARVRRLQGRASEACDDVRQALAEARRDGSDACLGRALAVQGAFEAVRARDPSSAEAVLDDAARRLAADGTPEERAAVEVARADLARTQGDIGAARVHAERALALASVRGGPVEQARARLAAGLTAVERGEEVEGRAHVEAVLEVAEATGELRDQSLLHAVLATFAALGGRRAEAEEALAQVQALAASVGPHISQLFAREVRAWLVLDRDPAAAVPLFREAVEAWAAGGHTHEAGLAAVALGGALFLAGRELDAERAWREVSLAEASLFVQAAQGATIEALAGSLPPVCRARVHLADPPVTLTGRLLRAVCVRAVYDGSGRRS